MIELNEACRIALAFFEDAPKNAFISSISEMDDAWVFFLGAGEGPRYGAAAVRVVKDTGEANAFAPFFGNNVTLLEDASKLEVPMEYRATGGSVNSR